MFNRPFQLAGLTSGMQAMTRALTAKLTKLVTAVPLDESIDPKIRQIRYDAGQRSYARDHDACLRRTWARTMRKQLEQDEKTVEYKNKQERLKRRAARKAEAEALINGNARETDGNSVDGMQGLHRRIDSMGWSDVALPPLGDEDDDGVPPKDLVEAVEQASMVIAHGARWGGKKEQDRVAAECKVVLSIITENVAMGEAPTTGVTGVPEHLVQKNKDCFKWQTLKVFAEVHRGLTVVKRNSFGRRKQAQEDGTIREHILNPDGTWEEKEKERDAHFAEEAQIPDPTSAARAIERSFGVVAPTAKNEELTPEQKHEKEQAEKRKETKNMKGLLMARVLASAEKNKQAEKEKLKARLREEKTKEEDKAKKKAKKKEAKAKAKAKKKAQAAAGAAGAWEPSLAVDSDDEFDLDAVYGGDSGGAIDGVGAGAVGGGEGAPTISHTGTLPAPAPSTAWLYEDGDPAGGASAPDLNALETQFLPKDASEDLRQRTQRTYEHLVAAEESYRNGASLESYRNSVAWTEMGLDRNDSVQNHRSPIADGRIMKMDVASQDVLDHRTHSVLSLPPGASVATTMALVARSVAVDMGLPLAFVADMLMGKAQAMVDGAAGGVLPSGDSSSLNGGLDSTQLAAFVKRCQAHPQLPEAGAVMLAQLTAFNMATAPSDGVKQEHAGALGTDGGSGSGAGAEADGPQNRVAKVEKLEASMSDLSNMPVEKLANCPKEPNFMSKELAEYKTRVHNVRSKTHHHHATAAAAAAAPAARSILATKGGIMMIHFTLGHFAGAQAPVKPKLCYRFI
jgi:hypothetical protein